MDIDTLIEHVKMLERETEKARSARIRARDGLRFARQQAELTKGFPNAKYWAGKIDAYHVILHRLGA